MISSPVNDQHGWQERVSIERDRFTVLLHLQTWGELSTAGSWTRERIMRDLGFSRERAELLLSSLVRAGFLCESGVGDGLALTSRAMSYLTGGAGRRRSVRLTG